MSFLDNPIKVGYQYPTEIMRGEDNLRKYFYVGRDRIKSASYMEKELLIHDILLRLKESGYIPNHWTDTDVQNDLEYMRSFRMVYNRTMYSAHPHNVRRDGPRMSYPTVERYIDTSNIPGPSGTMRQAFDDHVALYLSSFGIVNLTRWDMSIASVLRYLRRMGYGRSLLCPPTYATIFRDILKSPGKVIGDVYPSVGSRAIAAALTGTIYKPFNDSLDSAIANGFADAIGLKLSSGNCDIIVHDPDMRQSDMSHVFDYLDMCKQLLVFVHSRQSEFLSIRKPTRVFNIMTRVAGPNDYYALYTR